MSLTLLNAGCGGGLYPVEGRVLLRQQPLMGKDGAIVLKPDVSKGNKAAQPGVGVLQRDGTFVIETNGQPGVPLGWYKVTLVVTEPDANPNEDARRVVNARYETEVKTPLAIEVVAEPGPGSYDLQLTP